MSQAIDEARELAALPVYTKILNVDTGERGESHVSVPLELRDRILAKLEQDRASRVLTYEDRVPSFRHQNRSK